MSRALIQSRRADTCTYQPIHSSAFFTKLPVVYSASVQFKKHIFTDTRTHLGTGEVLYTLYVTPATLAFCNDTATVFST